MNIILATWLQHPINSLIDNTELTKKKKKKDNTERVSRTAASIELKNGGFGGQEKGSYGNLLCDRSHWFYRVLAGEHPLGKRPHGSCHSSWSWSVTSPTSHFCLFWFFMFFFSSKQKNLWLSLFWFVCVYGWYELN